MTDNKAPSLEKIKKFDQTFPEKIKEAAKIFGITATTVIKFLWEGEHKSNVLKPLLPMWDRYQKSLLTGTEWFSRGATREKDRKRWKNQDSDH